MSQPEKVFIPISDDYAFEHPEVFLSGELEPFQPSESGIDTECV